MGRAHMVCSPQKAQHFTYLRPPCRGNGSETPPAWVLSAPGICEEGRLSPLCCEEAESETRSECVGSHDASSGLVLGRGGFRERRLWSLKDL